MLYSTVKTRYVTNFLIQQLRLRFFMTFTNILPASRQHFVFFSLVIGAVMISFSGVWVELSHVTPTASAFYRVFFGSIVLLAATFFRREIRMAISRASARAEAPSYCEAFATSMPSNRAVRV